MSAYKKLFTLLLALVLIGPAVFSAEARPARKPKTFRRKRSRSGC